jgi:riboflavin kinase/FMN adenylyltransferase
MSKLSTSALMRRCPVYRDPAVAGASFEGRSVVCIGTFDGVHRGHQAILARGRAIAEARDLYLTVVTFHPHPKSVVAPQKAPRLLSSPEEKAALLAAYGARSVVQLQFDRELASTPATVFLERWLRDKLRMAALVFGHDFRFGRGREGDPHMLRQWGDANDCQVELVEAVMDVDLNQRISSSLIRRLLNNEKYEECPFDTAISLLGHPYPVTGEVVNGAGRGKKIGYPTWNLRLSELKLPPPVGIYAAWAQGAKPRPAMVYYGSNPTFGGREQILEAHLIDVDDDTRPETEETIWLTRFVRDEVQFDGAEALKAQLADDRRVVRDMLSTPKSQTPTLKEQ